MISQWILGGCWVTFAVVWNALRLTNKRTVKRGPVWAQIAVGLTMAATVAAMLKFGPARHIEIQWVRFANHVHPAIAASGIALAVSGFLLAYWARFALGRNWGMPMTLREGHELVTGGPYAFVRHPIYSGLLLAFLGSALAEGPPFLAAMLVAGTFFIFSARVEEREMSAQFPDTYPAYRNRTKMLIPFVL